MSQKSLEFVKTEKMNRQSSTDDGYSGSQLSANSNMEQNPFFTENTD